MSNYLTSIIRTYVPIIVGSIASWLVVEYGVVVSDDIKNQAVAMLTGVLIGAYYAIVRVLENRWPVFGKLLGRATTPTYDV